MISLHKHDEHWHIVTLLDATWLCYVHGHSPDPENDWDNPPHDPGDQFISIPDLDEADALGAQLCPNCLDAATGQ